MKPTTLSDFARHIGVSTSAVRKAISVGRIPAAALTARTLSSGRSVPAIADIQLAEAAFLGSVGSARQAVDSGRPQSGIAAESIPDIATSKATVEAFKAKLIQLEYDERSATLVNAVKIRQLFTAQVVAARTRLLGVPTKAKSRLPHLSVDDIGALTDLIREALTDIADGRAETMNSATERQPK